MSDKRAPILFATLDPGGIMQPPHMCDAGSNRANCFKHLCLIFHIVFAIVFVRFGFWLIFYRSVVSLSVG